MVCVTTLLLLLLGVVVLPRVASADAYLGKALTPPIADDMPVLSDTILEGGEI